MAVAVLALQGAFLEHEQMLERLGVEHFEIRRAEDLCRPFHGLILPGGESTVMGKLLQDLALFEPLRRRILEGLPVLGTCAGLILLAKKVEGGTPCFATMDMTVVRNAYGRQLGSFFTEESWNGEKTIPMTFIRAPYIAALQGDAQCLSTVDGRMVAARQGRQVVTAFHPELNQDTTVHEYFLSMINN